MIKAFIVCIGLFIGCFTTLFFTRYINYKLALKEELNIIDHSSQNNTKSIQIKDLSFWNYNESHPVIKSLIKLIQIPIVGQFFMDQKIYQLAKLGNWQAIVNESQYIVKTSANKYSFDVWYHKALAECSLGMLQECQESAKNAQMFASNKNYRVYTKSLYNYLRTALKDKNQRIPFYGEL